MDDGGFGVLLFELFVVIFYASCFWKLFDKMEKPAWSAVIPIYNAFVLTQALNKPVLWFILTLIPGVNLVVGLILLWDLIRSFGKGTGYFVATLFLSFITLPVLAFGEARFTSPAPLVRPAPEEATT